MFMALLTNIIILIGSCILPTIVGVLSYHFYNSNHSTVKIIRIFSTVFESICPVVLLVVLYYNLAILHFKINVILLCVIAFSISFIGYMPTRYNPDYTAIKNAIVNLLGMASSIFKWSFCAGMIGAADFLRVGTTQTNRTFNPLHLVLVLIISFGICLLLEFGKYLAQEKL